MMGARSLVVLATLSAVLVLAGCGSTSRKGGYYKDDGPGSDIPADILNTPDAVPRIESYAPANLRPYRVLGRTYVPITSNGPFRQSGIASWYGRKFHGQRTANGEVYDMYAMTAAHPTLPIPSYARVSRSDTGAAVIVRINDRGPFHDGRVIDLSYAAAARLGLVGSGSGRVTVEWITHQDIARGEFKQPVQTAAAAQPQADVPTVTMAVAEPARVQTHAVEVPDALAVLETQAGMLSATDQAASGGALPIPTFEQSGGAQVYLQFGAFSGLANAESLAAQLNREISMVESRQAQVKPSSTLYRVQIGPYPSRTEAVNAAVRIQERTGAQATVATRD